MPDQPNTKSPTDTQPPAAWGGLPGRFHQSLDLLADALETLQDYLLHCTSAGEYDGVRPVLQQADAHMERLRRLSDYAADAALAPDLPQMCPLQPLDLRCFLQDIAALFAGETRPDYPQSSLTLDVPANPVPVMAQERLLTGLLVNLFSNSLQAKPGTAIHLALTHQTLLYRDDGPGLPAEARALLEEGAWSEGLLQAGSIGLLLVRRYTAAMNWKIALQPGPGLAVQFSLPPCAVNLEKLVLQNSASARTERKRRCHILFSRELTALRLKQEAPRTPVDKVVWKTYNNSRK